MNQPNYNQIIPQEIQEILIAIRDQDTAHCWTVGDICWQIKKYADEQKNMIPTMEIYSAVGCFVGKSSRTVREYAMLSKFYVLEMREVYAVLSFAHFKKARSAGPRWQMALEWCVEIGELAGRPATVDALEAYIATNITTYQDMQDEQISGDQKQAPDDTQVHDLKLFLEGVIHKTHGIKKALAIRTPNLLTEKDQRRIDEAVNEIEEVLNECLVRTR